MKLKYLIPIVVACFIVISTFIFQRVPIPNHINECIKVEGVITEITEGGTFDVKFKLKADPDIYYINRGLERGLELIELQERLMGNNVTFYYPEYWTLLDPNSTIHHLNQVDFEGEVIFTEIGIGQ